MASSNPINVSFRSLDRQDESEFRQVSDAKIRGGEKVPLSGGISNPSGSAKSGSPSLDPNSSAGSPAVDEKLKPLADVGAAAAKPETQPRSSAVAGDQQGGEPDSGEPEEEEEDEEEKPWKLFQPKNVEMGGWSQTGYHTRSDRMFNNFPDHFQQHQTWFFAEKKADG